MWGTDVEEAPRRSGARPGLGRIRREWGRDVGPAVGEGARVWVGPAVGGVFRLRGRRCLFWEVSCAHTVFASIDVAGSLEDLPRR